MHGLRPLLARLRLLPQAWRLHGTAQLLAANGSLDATRAAMLDGAPPATSVRPEDAVWAARWAGRLRRRLQGQLDTCLVRSLVAGALVADDPDVAVRIGVQRPRAGADLLDAHAWLTVADREIPAGGESSEPFEEVLVLPMERAG